MKKRIINLILIFVLIVLGGILLWRYTPICANYYYNKGKLLYEAGNYNEAVSMFEQATNINPDNAAYTHFYVASLTKVEPTYFVQEKLYNISRSNADYSAKSLAKSYVSNLRNEFLDGLEDNYIVRAVATSEIIHWNLEDFPIKVYIQKNDSIPDYYCKMVRSALKEWEKRSGFISFSEVKSESESNISVVFKDTPKGNCDKNGCPYVVATTEHNVSNKNVLEKMVISFFKTNPYGDDFLSNEIYHTALHELGHALGIMGHSDSSSDIMYSNNYKIYDLFAAYRPKLMDISQRDINTLTLLYKIYPTITNSKIKNKEKYIYGPIVIGNDDSVLQAKLIELKKYINKYPQISAGYINISAIYEQLGEYEEAVENLKKAYEFAKTPDEYFLIEYNYAIISFNSQKFEQAKEHVQKALSYREDKDVRKLLEDIDKIMSEIDKH